MQQNRHTAQLDDNIDQLAVCIGTEAFDDPVDGYGITS
jgi:hypothetical protein